MVVIVFVLGLALIVVAVVALFKGVKGEQGELSVSGIKVSGAGGALFLVMGVVLLFTSKGWADSLSRRNELALAVGQYQLVVKTLEQRSRLLEASLPRPQLTALKTEHAPLFMEPDVRLSPKALVDVQRVQPGLGAR